MTGYVRQSAADIVPTAVVRAAPINNELNALRDAFAQSGGHKHNGTAAEGEYIPLIADTTAKDKVVIDATNHRVGVFVNVSGTSTEQVRVQDGAVLPITTNDVDLGSNTLKFKDLTLAGTATLPVANIASGTIVATDLTVTGTIDVTNTVISNVSTPTLSSEAANKGYVDTAISNLINGAPGTLDTLNEIATALGSDASFSATITSSLAGKLATAGGTMSGNIAMGNNKVTGLGAPTTGSDATTKTYVDDLMGDTVDAAASAVAAAASATAAAASYDSFDDRYLGSKSSAPSVDNDGNPLVTGAIYFNSTTNVMNVYTGSVWQAAVSVVNGTASRQVYTATAGQTTFAITYDVGFVDVYLNGVKLVTGTDFTASNGTSIVLATAAVVGDLVDIIAYGTFNVANTYTQAAADAKFATLAGVETLTNKTIAYADNTLTGVAGTTATQTLTNKTLTSPVLTTPNITTGLTLAGSAGTAGQTIISGGSGVAPTWGTAGGFSTDLSYGDYSLTLSSAIASTVGQNIRMQAVSLDGTSELMIIYSNASAHAVVWDSSTNTFGTPVLVRTADFTNVNTIALAKISSTSVLVCSLPSATIGLSTVVLTISGSTITVGTAVATTLSGASDLIAANTRLVTVGSSYVLNYYNTTGTTPKFRAITVSGSTPTVGSELAYTAGGTTNSMHHSYAQSASILLSFSFTASTTVFALPITVSGTTLTAGTAATVATTGPSFFVTGALSSSRYALYYLNTTGRGAVVSVAGSTASISTAATAIAIVATGPVMQVFGNQAFIMPGGGASDNINVLTDTGGTATLGTDLPTPGSQGSFVGFLSTGKVLYASTTAGQSDYHQYGISAGSAVLEKSFQNVTSTSVVTVQVPGTASYSRPLAGPPQSGSGNNVMLRTSAGKIAPGTSGLLPFTASFDGTSPAKLQQIVNPFASYNDGISEAVAWGIPTSQRANTTTVQLRKVTLV